MEFFDTFAQALNFDRNEAHEPNLPREHDEDADAREFFALNLAFN